MFNSPLRGFLARAVAALEARGAAPSDRVLVYCWRGGMRSGSVGWLLGLCGFDVCTLEGGYRSYRRWCKTVVGQKELPAPAPVVVLGGCTGVGKTAVLHELCAAGEQFLDLEVRPPADPRCRAPHYKLHSHR